MSNESTNHSEENVTYDDKRNRLIDIIKKIRIIITVHMRH